MGLRRSLSVLHMFSTAADLSISQALDPRSQERASLSKLY